MARDLLSHLLHSPKPDARKPSTTPATRRAQAQASEAQHIRELIFQMVAENPTWGALRIHGELPMLGFEVSRSHCVPLDEARTQES
jgi:hypothetical protein